MNEKHTISKGVKEQARVFWWKGEKKKTRQKTKNLGIIKCCIFIAHSKGEYINGNDEETTTIRVS